MTSYGSAVSDFIIWNHIIVTAYCNLRKKKATLKISKKSREKICALLSFLIKLHTVHLQIYQKEILVQALVSKSMEWLLYDRDLRHERVTYFFKSWYYYCDFVFKNIKIQKKDNDVTVCRHGIISHFFWRFFCFSCQVSLGPSFYVNTMIGSGVITTFVYKRLTGNSEIGNTPACVLPISGDWDESGILSFARMSLIRCYWMLQNARVLAFTVFELLRENQQRSKITPQPPRLGLIIPLFVSVIFQI